MKVLFCLIWGWSVVGYGQDFNNVTFLDNWHNKNLLTSSTSVRYNECWAFVRDGKEYAVLGSTEGTHFFEITPENKLLERGFIKGTFSSAQVVHRDFKTYKNYLYSVCDEGISSLQVIDISYLPDSVHLVSENSNEIGRAHNLFVDEENDLLYALSVTPIINGQAQTPYSMRVFSLNDPEQPELVYSGPDDIAEVHDGFVRNNIAILNCGMDGIRRYDFTNPQAPVFLQNIPFYPDQGYNHQGWLSPNGETYIFADETNGKRVKKCSVNSSGDLTLQHTFGTAVQQGSVPHNLMIDNQFAFVAYYNYGLRIYDYTKTPVEEVAHYDTYPDNTIYQMNGAWGVYSDLPSERIIVSDRMYGLFLLDFNRKIFKDRTEEVFYVYPNPIKSGEKIRFFLNSSYVGVLHYAIIDQLGKSVQQGTIEHYNYGEIDCRLASGRYTLIVNYDKNQEDVTRQLPIIVLP